MIFVADNDDGALLGFSTTANADATPSAVIEGSNTTLSAANQNGYPSYDFLAFDGIGSLYTGGFQESTAAVFPTGANGNVPPTFTLNAPYINAIALDSTGRAYISAPTEASPAETTQIEIFAKGAMGMATPTATISGSATGLVDPRAMVVDASGNLYVVNFTHSNPDTPQILIYADAAMNSGNATPSIIAGANTSLAEPTALAFDNDGNLLVSDEGPTGNGYVLVFSKGSTGNVAPTKTISASGIGALSGVAVDASNNIWVSDLGNNGVPQIVEFAAGSNGTSVTPIKQISGAATMIKQPYSLVYVPGSAITDAKLRRSFRGALPTRR